MKLRPKETFKSEQVVRAFDVEADNFLEDITVIHSLVIYDFETEEYWSFADQPGYRPIKEGLKLLQEADVIMGHNITMYDVPALKKVYPDWDFDGELLDTMIVGQLLYTDLKGEDMPLLQQNKLPGKFFGSHGLEAWGFRLGNFKQEYKELDIHYLRAVEKAGITITGLHVGNMSRHSATVASTAFEGETKAEVARAIVAAVDDVDIAPFAEWIPEMQDYCVQDVVVTVDLWEKKLKGQPIAQRAFELEHDASRVCSTIEQCGFAFKKDDAEELYRTLLEERMKLSPVLAEAFGSWWAPNKSSVAPNGLVTVKKTRYVKAKNGDGEFFPDIRIKRYGKKGQRLKDYVGPPKIRYLEGAQYTKIKRIDFSPTSRDHIADRLITKYDWTPTKFTPGGKPQVDEKTLKGLDYPEAKLLRRYFMLEKRISQLAEGNKAWLKFERDGFVKGSYFVNGTVTGRAAHSNPNIGQVPAADEKVPYGKQCRRLFGAPRGWSIVGTDFSGLELRCLGHFMAKWDQGAYISLILDGDIHWTNAVALNLVPHGTEYQGDEFLDRDKKVPNPDYDPWHNTARNKIAKTFIYALLYGAGDEKLGRIYTAHRPLTDKEIQRYSKDGRIKKMLERRNIKHTPRMVATIKMGQILRDRFMGNLPAFKSLIGAVKGQVKKRKASQGRMYLNGLDGRELHVRSDHSALNTLLQSAGAILCKDWLVKTYDALIAKGLKPAFETKDGKFVTRTGEEADFAFLAWVHDEIQIGVKEGLEEVVGQIAQREAKKTGRSFDFRAITEADYKIGKDWSETH